MINRVLIRNKVVQVLYSCLLVSKKFQLAEPPAQPTKEKRYAYGLYVDMLALFVMLARRVEFRKSYPRCRRHAVARDLQPTGNAHPGHN